MKSFTKLIVRAARPQVSATSSLPKSLLQSRVSAFTQVPKNNFWKKNEKEGEEDVEEKYKAQFEEAAKAEKAEKEAAEKAKKEEAEQQAKKTKEDEEWFKEQELKDKKREEENRKTREKEADKKLPNKIEDLVKLGTEEAQKKILSMYKELKDNTTKLESQNKILSEEKASYANQTSQWQEKAKEFKKIVESTLDDMELMRIRLEKEKDQTKIFAITKFAGEVLEINDNIERALQANKELEGKDNSLFEGTLMTQKILEQILTRNGVIKLNPEGEKFDPNFHDALCQVPDPTKEAGSVAFVAQTGYKIHERVLRPAKVGVTYKV